jgi:hypothetical protein
MGIAMIECIGAGIDTLIYRKILSSRRGKGAEFRQSQAKIAEF